MFLPRKVVALTLGTLTALGAVAAAQGQNPSKGSETLMVGGQIHWLEKSDVSALTEGVVRQLEANVGDRVKGEKPIGSLHAEKAELAVRKAEVAFKNEGAIAKAQAQRALAIADLARLQTLVSKNAGFVSKAELDKADAEVKMALALVQEATEQKALAGRDLALAEHTLAEHTVLAPFDGVVTDRFKNAGESVRANEPLMRVGRIDRLRFVGYVPIQAMTRLRGNEVVDVTPIVDGADLPAERQRFRGKLKGFNPEVVVGKTEMQVVADIENVEVDGKQLLMPGMKAEMTIYLDGAAPAVGARTASKPTR